jgi:hypothetical protein
MQSGLEKSFNDKRFLAAIVVLVVTSLIDISVVKVNDLIDKNFIPIQSKLILFSANSVLCLLSQYYIIKQVRSSIRRDRLNKMLKAKAFYLISLTSLCTLGALMGFLIFQQLYYSYYDTSLIISIIAVCYGSAAALVIWLSLLFFSWYKSNHSLLVLLYFISMLGIAFNLIVAAALTSIKVNDRPPQVGEYVGGAGDISGGRHLFFDNIYRISSFVSFFGIWATTAILMNHYREKLANAIIYWIILSIPFVYFLVTYFYQFFLGNLLLYYLAIDPITVSILLGAFLALSKPIGGIVFGVAFWKISKAISYEKNVKTYMIISGWGIFLIFSADQATAQIVSPYPSFGIVTVTVLNVGAFLMLMGIYNSAVLVSANNNLRKSIHNYALESKLLGLIGTAEMENEIQKTVTRITQDNESLMTATEEPIELDGTELKKYIDFVMTEIKKETKKL